MTNETEEQIKADIAKAEAEMKAAMAKATGMVKPHMIWLAGGVGALLGFILGKVTGHG